MKTPKKITATQADYLVTFVGKRNGNVAYSDGVVTAYLPLTRERIQELREKLLREKVTDQGIVLDGNVIVFTSLTRLDE